MRKVVLGVRKSRHKVINSGGFLQFDGGVGLT